MKVDGSLERRAFEAEKAARDRITTAQNAAEEAERESRARIDEVRDEFSKQSEVENARQAAAVEAERGKAYQQIREMQRRMATESNRVKREGEMDLEKTTAHYRNEILREAKRGKSELDENRSAQKRLLEYEKQNANNSIETIKAEHQMASSELKRKSEEDFEAMKQESLQRFNEQKLRTDDATHKSEVHFQERYLNQVKHQEDTLANLNARTSEAIDQTRIDTEAKLSAYADRQQDPFYKLVSIDARLDEHDDSFVLSALIPEHERDHLSVSIRGGQVVVSGFRRNEETLKLEPGHTQSTAAFQSFSESFPLNWPVDARRLERTFEGDRLVVRIPKRPAYDKQEIYKAKSPEKVRAEQPRFPGKLPNVEERKQELAEKEGIKPGTIRDRASRAGRSLA